MGRGVRINQFSTTKTLANKTLESPHYFQYPFSYYFFHFFPLSSPKNTKPLGFLMHSEYNVLLCFLCYLVSHKFLFQFPEHNSSINGLNAQLVSNSFNLFNLEELLAPTLSKSGLIIHLKMNASQQTFLPGYISIGLPE